MLRKINKTVAAIAEETKRPALMDRFRLPHGDGDTELAAKLRSFGAALEQEQLLPTLRSMRWWRRRPDGSRWRRTCRPGRANRARRGRKRRARRLQFPETLKEARSCKKTFDAIYGNFYEGNTEILAAWASASHVPRQSGGGGGGSEEGKPGSGGTPPK